MNKVLGKLALGLIVAVILVVAGIYIGKKEQRPNIFPTPTLAPVIKISVNPTLIPSPFASPSPKLSVSPSVIPSTSPSAMRNSL